MVKIGIIGADSPVAGEILRILIHHPEVEVLSLYAPSLLGRNVSSAHHGFIGENIVNFSDKIDPNDLDLIILSENSSLTNNLVSSLADNNDLKLISLSKDWLSNSSFENIEIGLSEINRKALVRGARVAYIPSAIVVATLVPLIPLANYLLLNSDINVELDLPKDLISEVDLKKEQEEIEHQLTQSQKSFKDSIILSVKENVNSDRTLIATLSLKNSLSIDELDKIYEGIYDDHNFTFIANNEIIPEEVEGTHKTVITLDKPDQDTLTIKVMADARMRGGAGDVVHVLNLFFGLHEKTGLTLKPSRFQR